MVGKGIVEKLPVWLTVSVDEPTLAVNRPDKAEGYSTPGQPPVARHLLAMLSGWVRATRGLPYRRSEMRVPAEWRKREGLERQRWRRFRYVRYAPCSGSNWSSHALRKMWIAEI